MKYGYIYLTYCKVSGKIYIGQKHWRRHRKNHLGGGKLLKLAVEKYGRENFEKHIIEECDTDDELNKKEIFWISYYNSTDKDVGYNITEGGQFNRTIKGERHPFYNVHRYGEENPNYGNKMDEESKKSISIKAKERYKSLSNKQKEEIRNKLSKSLKGRKLSEEHKEKIRQSLLGKPLSKERKDKISKAHKGKKLSKETVEKIKLKNTGKKRSKEFSDKMSKINSGRVFSEETKEKMSNSAKDRIKRDGPPKTAFKKGNISSTKGKICITNGVDDKYIFQKELEEYESIGWRKGRTKGINHIKHTEESKQKMRESQKLRRLKEKQRR